jgi:hypothetical protein
MKLVAIGGDNEADIATLLDKHSLSVPTFKTLALFAEYFCCDGVVIAQSLMGSSGFIRNYGAWSKHSKHPAPQGYEHAAVIDTVMLDTLSVSPRFEGVRYLCAFKLLGENPRDKWEDIFQSCSRFKEDFCLGVYLPLSPFAALSSEESLAYLRSLRVCEDVEIRPHEVKSVLGSL